jgi:aspartyl-tRNA synthetase
MEQLPHGGIAFGLDRLTTVPRRHRENIRDVIAFPEDPERKLSSYPKRLLRLKPSNCRNFISSSM